MKIKTIDLKQYEKVSLISFGLINLDNNIPNNKTQLKNFIKEKIEQYAEKRNFKVDEVLYMEGDKHLYLKKKI